MTETIFYRAERLDNRDISILEYWHALLSDWRLVAAAIAATTLTSGLFAFLLPPLYRAEVTVVQGGQEGGIGSTTAMLGQLGGLASLAGINLGSLGGGSSEYLAILKSRMIVEEFIRRNTLLPVLFADVWNSDTATWATEPDDTPTLWRGVKYFTEEVLTVQEYPAEGIIRVGIKWADPDLAAQWANGLVALANEFIRSRDLAEAERNVAYLNNEIQKTNVVELQQVLYALVRSEMQTIMLANARVEYAFRVVDPAMPPETRSFPNRTLFIAGGIALGGFLGLILVLVRLIARKQVDQ